MNKRTIPAIIVATLAAGATAAAPYYDVNITQQLCTPACVETKLRCSCRSFPSRALPM